MKKNTAYNLASPLFWFLIVSSLSVSSVSLAGLYKGVDENGNVVYSDQPFKSANEFTPPTVSVVDSKPIAKNTLPLQPLQPLEEVKKVKVTSYNFIKINSPKNEETLWNSQKISVNLSLKPALNTKDNHAITLFLDGNPIIEKSNNLTLSLNRLNRGRHSLQVKIVDKSNTVLKSSKINYINIKHGVQKRLKPAPASPQ